MSTTRVSPPFQWAAIGLLLCLCGPVQASTNSELLRSQALPAIEEGRFATALELLLNAVHEDGEDYISQYYLGYVYSRMGEYEGAITALSRAREGGVASERLGFELAYACYQNGEVGRAEALLTEHLAAHPEDRNSHFLLGMTRYRKALYGEVITPTTPRREGQQDEARAAIAYARRYTPDQRSVEGIAGLQAMLDELEGEKKAWGLSLSLGASYDSNVGFFPDEGQIPAEYGDDSDARSMLALEGNWDAYQRGHQSLGASYRFFQSRHQDIEQFDVRNHTLGLDYRASQQRLLYGANYQYHDYSLGGEAYRNTHSLAPLLIVDHGRGLNSYAKLTVQQHDYRLADDEGRDGRELELLYRLYLMGEARDEYGYLGLSGGRLQSDDAGYNRRSAGVNGGGQQRWLGLLWKGSIEYRLNDYSEGGTSREEGFVTARAGLTHHLNRRLSASLLLTAMRNDSTDGAYDFSRNLVDLMLRWEL